MRLKIDSWLRHVPALSGLPERTVAVYVLVSAIWIVFSDAAIGRLTISHEQHEMLQSTKGLLFVAVTALALYLILKYDEKQRDSLESQLSEVLSLTHDGTWSWDLSIDRIAVSGGGDATLGWAASREITDMASWKAAMHPNDWSQFGQQLENLGSGEDEFTFDFRVKNQDANWVWFRSKGIVTSRDSEGSPHLIHGTYYNIDTLVRAELAAERSNRALAILIAANRILDNSTSAEQLSKGICESIANVRRFPFVRFSRVTDSPDGLTVLAEAGRTAANETGRRLVWDDCQLAQTPVGHAMTSGAPVTIEDLRFDPAFEAARDIVESHGLRSLIVVPVEVSAQSRYILEIYSEYDEAFSDNGVEVFQTLAQDISFAFNDLELRDQYEDTKFDLDITTNRLERALKGSVAALATVVEKRDPYTAGHQTGVARLAAQIAEALGLTPDAIEGIYIGASMHDIGKIGVPTEILTKPGRLDESEIALIRRHAAIGHEIVMEIDFGWPVDEIVHQHHERYDGSGYPQGLSGENIALEARIVAVADVIESMATDRPYRKSHTWEDVIGEVTTGRGNRYDPDVVDAALSIVRDRETLNGLLTAELSLLPEGVTSGLTGIAEDRSSQ